MYSTETECMLSTLDLKILHQVALCGSFCLSFRVSILESTSVAASFALLQKCMHLDGLSCSSADSSDNGLIGRLFLEQITNSCHFTVICKYTI